MVIDLLTSVNKAHLFTSLWFHKHNYFLCFSNLPICRCLTFQKTHSVMQNGFLLVDTQCLLDSKSFKQGVSVEFRIILGASLRSYLASYTTRATKEKVSVNKTALITLSFSMICRICFWNWILKSSQTGYDHILLHQPFGCTDMNWIKHFLQKYLVF